MLLVGAMCTMLQARDITPQRTQKAIDRFVDDSLMRHGSLGAIVVDVKSGKTLGARNENMACITASTMKTVTSSAALELLGADYTFNTPVYLEGEIQGSTLNGDIVIEGVGDPTLGSVYFKDNLDILTSRATTTPPTMATGVPTTSHGTMAWACTPSTTATTACASSLTAVATAL